MLVSFGVAVVLELSLGFFVILASPKSFAILSYLQMAIALLFMGTASMLLGALVAFVRSLDYARQFSTKQGSWRSTVVSIVLISAALAVFLALVAIAAPVVSVVFKRAVDITDAEVDTHPLCRRFAA